MFRSALYYPNTTIRSEKLLRNSLLLWDRLEVIVPWSGFTPEYSSREHARAFDAIGYCHEPSEDEKRRAHEAVEDFATAALPAPFSYRSAEPDDYYEMYSAKLLPQTWQLLKSLGLAGEYGAPTPVMNPTGLVLMGILADCCAGGAKARVTDRGSAYATLTGLLTTQEMPQDNQAALERLAAVSLRAIDISQVPLNRLLEFREREEKSSHSLDYRALRHRYADRLETYALRLVTLPPSGQAEVEREFAEDMRDDLRDLRRELQTEAIQILGSKEFVTSVVAVGALAAGSVAAPIVSGVLTASGGIVSVGGLLALKGKYAQSRRNVLREHPMAYLYEMTGRLKL